MLYSIGPTTFHENPDLLCGVPEAVFEYVLSFVEPCTIRALFQTCKATRDAVLRCIKGLSYSAQQSSTHAQLAIAGTRGAPLSMALYGIHTVNAVVGVASLQPWTAVSYLWLNSDDNKTIHVSRWQHVGHRLSTHMSTHVVVRTSWRDPRQHMLAALHTFVRSFVFVSFAGRPAGPGKPGTAAPRLPQPHTPLIGRHHRRHTLTHRSPGGVLLPDPHHASRRRLWWVVSSCRDGRSIIALGQPCWPHKNHHTQHMPAS